MEKKLSWAENDLSIPLGQKDIFLLLNSSCKYFLNGVCGHSNMAGVNKSCCYDNCPLLKNVRTHDEKIS